MRSLFYILLASLLGKPTSVFVNCMHLQVCLHYCLTGMHAAWQVLALEYCTACCLTALLHMFALAILSLHSTLSLQ